MRIKRDIAVYRISNPLLCANALKTKNILFENNHCSYSKMQILERFVELLFCITAFLLNEFFYYAFIEIKRVMMLVSQKK